MTSAIAKQRDSIRRQVQADGGNTTGFFSTPWMNNAPLASPASSQVTPLVPSSAGGDCEPLPTAELEKLIAEASERERVDPKLIHAMLKRESGGKPCAVSQKGAQGLMQLMPATQIDLRVQNPFDPAQNIAGGVQYIKQMLERYGGNVALALAAYNAGPQRVQPGGRIPDIPETQSYVMAILGAINEEPEPPATQEVK